MKYKLSVIIIVKNEEQLIKSAITSCSFAEEIIVINNGSSDNTAQIARNLGATVYDFPGNDFAKIRNYGLSKVKNNWLLYIDSDETVNNELKAEIIKIVNTSPSGAYRIKRINYYFSHKWPNDEYIVRLFHKETIKSWFGNLHESPDIVNQAVTIKNGAIIHYTHRSISQMLTKTNEWSNLESMNRYKINHPKINILRLVRVMLTGFYISYIKQGGYKANLVGLIESMYQAFSYFITYAKLYELQKN